jgi:DNA-binding transcriptional LysR family regulator
MPQTVGMMHILPLLPSFRARYPRVRPEWHFETRQVDLIAEGYDVAIGGGFERSAGTVARALAPAHIIAVASPAYLKERKLPIDPSGLGDLDGIVMRSLDTGRIRQWTMRDVAGREMAASLPATLVVNDPIAMREAALLGLGVTLIASADVHTALEAGTLLRLVPNWYADAGAISIYYASRKLLPAKTRVFVDWVTEAFKAHRLAERFAGSLR